MTAVTEGSSTCPGCGLLLPSSDWPVDPRRNASPACWHLYTTVTGHELSHVRELGGVHQLTVDAYSAQHAGQDVPPIGVAFALIGLYLTLDQGWSGSDVRAAHQDLASRFQTWPQFTPPAQRAPLTVAHVAGSPSPEEHASRVRAWAESVWQAWSAEHGRVRAWAAETLTDSLRTRLRAD